MNISTPALVVNRLCGSGFQSIVSAVQDIAFGDANIAVAGGTENMSQAPFIARNMRFGTKLGTNYNLEDSLWASLTDEYTKTPMVSESDEKEIFSGIRVFSPGDYRGELSKTLQYHSKAMRWICHSESTAIPPGTSRWSLSCRYCLPHIRSVCILIHFKEIAPIEIKSKKGPHLLSADEHPKPATTLEVCHTLTHSHETLTFFTFQGFVKASSSFRQGRNCGRWKCLWDLWWRGFSCVSKWGSGEETRPHSIGPHCWFGTFEYFLFDLFFENIFFFAAWHYEGVEPSEMGIGPAPAIRGVLRKTKLCMYHFHWRTIC